jgi:hypothetical protein
MNLGRPLLSLTQPLPTVSRPFLFLNLTYVLQYLLATTLEEIVRFLDDYNRRAFQDANETLAICTELIQRTTTLSIEAEQKTLKGLQDAHARLSAFLLTCPDCTQPSLSLPFYVKPIAILFLGAPGASTTSGSKVGKDQQGL